MTPAQRLGAAATARPTTTSGRLLLAAGLTFHSGRRLADHPDLVAAIEAEAREQAEADLAAAKEEIGYLEEKLRICEEGHLA